MTGSTRRHPYKKHLGPELILVRVSDRFFLLTDRVFSSKTPWRRGWDSNPRKVALHTLSKRADSAALAPLLVVLLHDIGG